MSAALVECWRAARTYGRGGGTVIALHPVTCAIGPGARIALVGPSGSGKSTLVFLLAGLERPSSGEVRWPAIGDRTRLRPGPVAVVFQGVSLLPALTVAENVALPLQLGGAPPERIADRVTVALDRLDLGSLADALPDEISGGQSQRAAVARCVAGEPQLILADEPTGQLDRAASAGVVDALFAAADATGAALVVATHDPVVADRLDACWQLQDGHVIGASEPA